MLLLKKKVLLLKRKRILAKLNPSGNYKSFTFDSSTVPGETLKDKADNIIAFSAPLRFANYEKHTNVIKEFIQDFFELNKKHDTVYLNGRMQTPRGKFRSLGDIYLIVRHYFPRISLATVIIELYKPKENSELTLNTQLCNQIKKRVYDQRKGGLNRNAGSSDELGLTSAYYLSVKKDE